jgi:ABC-2 type transport system permease protein
MIQPITEGKVRGFIVIPSYFSEFRKNRNLVAPIQVIADGSEPNTANFVQIYVQGAFSNWLRQQEVSERKQGLPLVQIENRVWYNEQLSSRYFIFSGSIAIIMTLIGTLLTALVVAREWERGTMEALMSTPVGILELVLGKLIPYFALGMISMLICVFVTVVGFGLPLRGSFFLLMFVTAIFLLGALGLGLMISTIVKNQIVAYQISIVAGFLPAYILSGFLFEISSMPFLIQLLTYLLPARYFVQSLQTIFLVGNVWSLILYNLIPLVLIGLIFFAITAAKTVKRLD